MLYSSLYLIFQSNNCSGLVAVVPHAVRLLASMHICTLSSLLGSILNITDDYETQSIMAFPFTSSVVLLVLLQGSPGSHWKTCNY